jgi:hypothetical protein
MEKEGARAWGSEGGRGRGRRARAREGEGVLGRELGRERIWRVGQGGQTSKKYNQTQTAAERRRKSQTDP